MAVTLAANALVSLDDMKMFMGIPTSETGANDLLTGFINSASGMVERYCRRKFRGGSIVEIRDGLGVNEILVDQWPINSVTSLHIDEDRIFGAETLVDTSEYGLMIDSSEAMGIVLFNRRFPKGAKIIRIAYSFGYAALADVPSDLAMGAKFIAGYYYQRCQQKDYTMTTKAKGEENITMVDGIPKLARDVIDSYRRPDLAEATYPVRNQN